MVEKLWYVKKPFRTLTKIDKTVCSSYRSFVPKKPGRSPSYVVIERPVFLVWSFVQIGLLIDRKMEKTMDSRTCYERKTTGTS
jgi:hypothetical protein